MAHITDTPRLAGSIANLPARVLSGVWAALMRVAEAQSRSHQIEALDALSDAELAQRGLTRDGIVRHVFRDRYHL